MTQTNDVVQALFARFPAAELASEEQRKILEKIRNRFSHSTDAVAELKDLYRVKGFSDFASVMLWILERSRTDPRLADTSPEDQKLLLSTFQKALGDQESPSAPSALPTVGAGDERGFASRLEHFSEAVQSGIEGRGALLESLFTDCETITNQTSEADFKQFGRLMADFLKYIAEGELLDDVRVINIVSNISSSISQWAMSPSDARSAPMEEALGMLRDFRTHFE